MKRNLYPLYIVDDEQSVLESMAFMLEGYGYDVRTFTCGTDFLNQAKLLMPGCVLLDSRMPVMRGQDIHQIMHQQYSPISIIYLTAHGDVPMAVEALKGGAIDFFQKPVDGDVLVASVDRAMKQSLINCEKLSAKEAFKNLTKREQEVLKLVTRGLKNQQMAEQLCVSLRTIEVHRSNVMKKFQSDNLAILIHKAELLDEIQYAHLE